MIVVFDLGGVLVRICRTWGQAMRVAGFQARAEHEGLWFDDAPPFKAFQSGAISEGEYLVGLAEFLGLSENSSPCLQGVELSPSPREGEVAPRSGDGGGNPGVPPSPTASGLPPLGGEDLVPGGGGSIGRQVHNGILRGEYAGAAELVQEIHARGGQTACLSNTNAIHWEVLTDAAYFPAVAALHHKLASHLLNLEKPDPAIYRHFEEATASAPTEIVFFDDLPANVEAARACGWSAHLIDHDGDTVAQMRATLGNMATWHR